MSETTNNTNGTVNENRTVQQQQQKNGPPGPQPEPEAEERPTTSLDSVDCFHGFITATEAEYRLRKCEIDGALILRADQNSVKQKFCLSWLSPTNHSVMHFPITRICGEYFLFGQPFTTLSDLIQAFISESRTAVVPLQPPSPVKLINRQRIAILPFRAMPDTDEISFCEGDLLTEIQRVDNDWAWARLEKNGKSGLVAVQLTVPLNNKSVKPEELPYFHDEPVNVLTQRLTQCGGGCYLLRRSTVQSDSFILMVNTGAHIEKFQIMRTSNGDFEIGGRIFATVPDIIERYSEKEICEGFHLMRAVLTSTFEGGEGLSTKNSDRNLHHLSSNNFYPQSALSTYAYRRCKEDKWKRCYVILSDSNGSQLYVLDHERRGKPKIVLDLSFCFMYKIPDNTFDRSNCLLVALNGLDAYPSLHLSFQNAGIYLNWLNALRLRCFGYRHPTSPFTVIPAMHEYYTRSTTIIYLTLANFRGSNFLKPDCLYSAMVMINGIVLTKTRQIMPVKNCIVFDSCYLLQYIPPGPCTLKFELCPGTKGRVTSIRDYLHKDISPLYVLPDDGKELCASAEDNFEGFLFRAVRHRIVLLPEEQYASFFVLLTMRSFALSTWIGSILDTYHRKDFVKSLLSVLLPDYDLVLSFIEVIVGEQILQETDLTLFRCDSFCTCCISTALRMIAKDLVAEEVANSQVTGLGKQELDVMNALKSLSEHLPLLFRAILSCVIKMVKTRFNDSTYIARRVASVFFVLRFVNPVLTLWTSECGSRRVARMIQSLANKACAPDYCPVMTSIFNVIYLAQKSSRAVRLMADLLDAFSLSPQTVEASENPFYGYSKVEQLALLAFQVEQVLKQQPEPENCPLPEAYTVISLLKKHAEKYLSS